MPARELRPKVILSLLIKILSLLLFFSDASIIGVVKEGEVSIYFIDRLNFKKPDFFLRFVSEK